MPPGVAASDLVRSTAFFRDMNRTAAMRSLRATRWATSEGVSARMAGPQATPQTSKPQLARRNFSFDSGIAAPTRQASTATSKAAPNAAAITTGVYDAAIGSEGGQMPKPL